MSDAAKVEVAEVKDTGILTRPSAGFNPKCREQQISACADVLPNCGRNGAFMSRFLKGIAIGFFLVLLIVLSIILLWSVGLNSVNLCKTRVTVLKRVAH